MTTFPIKTGVSGGRECACAPDTEACGLHSRQLAAATAPGDFHQPAASMTRRETDCSEGAQLFPKRSQRRVSPVSFQGTTGPIDPGCLLSAVRQVLTWRCRGREHRRPAPPPPSAGGQISGPSPLLLLPSPFVVHTGCQALLPNYCSAYFAPEAAISPLHVLLTYLILTCVRQSLLLAPLSR